MQSIVYDRLWHASLACIIRLWWHVLDANLVFYVSVFISDFSVMSRYGCVLCIMDAWSSILRRRHATHVYTLTMIDEGCQFICVFDGRTDHYAPCSRGLVWDLARMYSSMVNVVLVRLWFMKVAYIWAIDDSLTLWYLCVDVCDFCSCASTPFMRRDVRDSPQLKQYIVSARSRMHGHFRSSALLMQSIMQVRHAVLAHLPDRGGISCRWWLLTVVPHRMIHKDTLSRRGAYCGRLDKLTCAVVRYGCTERYAPSTALHESYGFFHGQCGHTLIMIYVNCHLICVFDGRPDHYAPSTALHECEVSYTT